MGITCNLHCPPYYFALIPRNLTYYFLKLPLMIPSLSFAIDIFIHLQFFLLYFPQRHVFVGSIVVWEEFNTALWNEIIPALGTCGLRSVILINRANVQVYDTRYHHNKSIRSASTSYLSFTRCLPLNFNIDLSYIAIFFFYWIIWQATMLF